MSETKTIGNGNAGQTLAPVSLLACPFCGAPGMVEEYAEERGGNLGAGTNQSLPWSSVKTWYRPKCSRCDCKLDNGWSKAADAAKEWNDRRAG